jgi:hypothetical protein
MTVLNARFFACDIEGVGIFAEADLSYMYIFAYTHKSQYLCEFRPLVYVCGLKMTVFNARFFACDIEGVGIFAEAELSYMCIFAYTHKSQYLCEFRPLVYVCGLQMTVFNARFFVHTTWKLYNFLWRRIQGGVGVACRRRVSSVALAWRVLYSQNILYPEM